MHETTPQQKAIEISYKFQPAGLTFNTHWQHGIVSLEFSDADKEGIRLRVTKWQGFKVFMEPSRNY